MEDYEPMGAQLSKLKLYSLNFDIFIGDKLS